jgi:hypothetical protein
VATTLPYVSRISRRRRIPGRYCRAPRRAVLLRSIIDGRCSRCSRVVIVEMVCRRFAVVLAALLVVSGCGRASEADNVRSVARRFYAALASSNGAEACTLISGEARAQLEREVRLLETQLSKRVDCATVVHAITKPPAISRRLRSVKVDSVVLTGDTATVRTTTPGGASPIDDSLVRTAKGWRINGPLLPAWLLTGSRTPRKPIGG